MSPSELKAHLNDLRMTKFFSRENMRFMGDTMANYGVRSAVIKTLDDPYKEVWELYRKRPVKNGLQGSHFFCKKTFAKVFPVPIAAS